MEKFKKVIFWGHPLHTHTHSYIHAGFKRAFEHLGYVTYWFTDRDDTKGFDFENSLFMAMGEDEKNIPLNNSSYYVLHNVDAKRYLEVGCKVLFIAPHTTNATMYLKDGDVIFNDYTFLRHDANVDCLGLCWATDLLPHEIDVESAINKTHNNTCVWIGTYGDSTGPFENGSIIDPFFNKSVQYGIRSVKINPWSRPISFEENRDIVANSFLAPALQGPWQVKHNYIPCRIFKNISYGSFGITNSAAVNDVFGGRLVYDPDPTVLFDMAIAKRNSPSYADELTSLMNEVKEKHTYIDRVKYVINCLPE